MTISPDMLIGILIGLVAIVALGLIRLEVKLRRLCRGAQGKDLEASMNKMHDGIESLQKFETESKSYFKNVERRLRRSAQAVDVVKFNAFKGDGLGGNQSFAAAILDEDGNGAVISSLYSRDRVSVFSKPIKRFAGEIELSQEETDAVSRAKAKLSA
ncbi:MAG: DUF4446 family protein [bacterium]|nr:DUF4446 family protein [bacterium]